MSKNALENAHQKDLWKNLNAFGFKFILIKRIHHTIYFPFHGEKRQRKKRPSVKIKR